jgi:hypothetical protein
MPIYVQHEVLGRIPDVFNAEAIWQAPGLALFSRRPLLRDLLERSPREHKGRAATRCFSHVTLMLPQEEVDDDYHLTRGARARDLVQTLTALHQKDFGDLLGADQVRYDVVGAETLAPGEIEVKFGHAVYLPAPDEKILYNVSTSRDSAIWAPVCPIYPNQRLALIGGDENAAGVVASGWPFGPECALLIVNDGPDAQPVVQMRPKEGYDCRFDARSGYYTIRSTRGGIDANGAAPRLLLKISRVGGAASHGAAGDSARPAAPAFGPRAGTAAMPDAGAGAPTGAAPAAARAPAFVSAASAGAGAGAGAATWPEAETPAAAAAPASAGNSTAGSPAMPAAPAVWQRRSGEARNPELTAIPISHRPAAVPANRAGESDSTYAPIAQQRVSLVALALPRLSRYRDTGAAALELPFNKALALSPDAESAIRISVNNADELYASTPAGRQRISVPSTFTPVDARTLSLLPVAPDMADRYCATLCLPQPIATGIASGARFTFGRNSTMLAALRVLDSPRFLLQAENGRGEGASADRIGLSRSAFSFEASPQGFKIGRLAATQALYHLDEKLGFVASIGDASADAPYMLPAGHHLVAGHYVLRFDA